MRKSKKLDKFLTREIIKEAIVSDEGLLERFKFEKRVPSVKTLVLSICYSILLIVITSLTTIFIYSKINNNQYKGNDIVYEAVEAFDEELDRTYVRKNIFQIDYNIVVGIYYSEIQDNYILLNYSSTKQVSNYKFTYNDIKYTLSSEIQKFTIESQEDNELIFYLNDEVIFSATF